MPKYTEEELIEKLKTWAKKHGKNPSQIDINKDKTMPNAGTYLYRFGSFNEAKYIAGLEPYEYQARKNFKEEELLERLKKWQEIHGKSPTERDLQKDKDMPSVGTYRYHFGTFNNAKKKAGLETFNEDSELNHVDGILKEWQRGRRGELAEESIKEYLRNLMRFKEYIEGKDQTLQTMKFEDIKDYILDICELYSKSTIITKFATIMNFLQYFKRKTIIERRKEKSPFDDATIGFADTFFKRHIKIIEDDSARDPALTKEEVEIIKEKLKDHPFLDTIFRLDLNFGLRSNEFHMIKAKEGVIRDRKQARKDDIWIDLSAGQLLIYRKKTRMAHLVALTTEMIQLIKKQLMLRKSYGVTHEYLFFSKTRRILKKYSIYRYYNEISEISSITVTSHKVRRTMATLLDEAGVPHAIIRHRIGHKPKDTTEHYKRYSLETRKKILEERVGIL